MNQRHESRQAVVKVILIVLMLFAVGRLLGFAVRFSRESLQMDFSAFYTAGEALNHGLSPYQNHITHVPPIWDGVDVFQHSRFLYPPLVATLFQPIAMLPYPVAKFLWTLFSLGCIGFALAITMKILKQNRLEEILGVSVFVSLFYPLLTLLERGQIDAFTLAVIMLAIKWGSEEHNHWQMASGLLWSLAVLFKLHSLFVFPFLIIYRRWKALLGFIAGGILLLGVSVCVNGLPSLLDYMQNQFPRISRFGEGGTEEMKLRQMDTLQNLLSDIPSGFTWKNGVPYFRESFPFAFNATVIRPLAHRLATVGLKLNHSQLSLLVFFSLFVLVWIWYASYRLNYTKLSIAQQLMSWQIVLIVILLSSPLTWVMNLVWLLPAVPLLLHKYLSVRDKQEAIYLSIGIIALFIAAIPDAVSFPLIVPYGERAFNAGKYLLAEVLLLLSLILLLTRDVCLAR
jgi:hypothetical protein